MFWVWDVCGQDVAVALLFDCKRFEYLAAISNSGQHSANSITCGQQPNSSSLSAK